MNKTCSKCKHHGYEYVKSHCDAPDMEYPICNMYGCNPEYAYELCNGNNFAEPDTLTINGQTYKNHDCKNCKDRKHCQASDEAPCTTNKQ